MTSCVPDCWQETTLQVDYAVALTLAVMGGTLPVSVAKELTGLLHDMVWLLAEFVKELIFRHIEAGNRWPESCWVEAGFRPYAKDNVVC